MKEKMTPGKQNSEGVREKPETADNPSTQPDQRTAAGEEKQLPYPVTSETIVNFRRWGAVAFRIPPSKN